MLLSVRSSLLTPALARVAKVAPKKVTLPILANVLIDVSDDDMTLTSTDLVTEVTVVIPAQIETPGIRTVNARRFAELMEIMDSDAGPVSIESANDAELSVTIESPALRSWSRFPTMNADDYPVRIDPTIYDDCPDVIFEAKDLKASLSQVLGGVSKHDNMPVLRNVHMVTDGFRYYMESTDAVTHQIKLSGETASRGESLDTMIPGDSLDHLRALIGDASEVVLTPSSESRVRFRWQIKGREDGDLTLYTASDLTTEYPDLKDFGEGLDFVRVERDALLRTVKTMGTLGGMCITLDAETAGTLAVSTESDYSLPASEQLSVSGQSGSAFFPPATLLKAVRSVPSDLVDVGLRGQTDISVLKAVDRDFSTIIVPGVETRERYPELSQTSW